MQEELTLQFHSIVRDSGKALLIDFGQKGAWLPISQCEIIDNTYSLIQVPDWLVKQHELEFASIDEIEEDIR